MEYQLHWRLRLALAGTGAAAFIVFRLLVLAPGLTETVYGRGIGPLFASMLSSIAGIVPFSLAEIVIVIFVGRQLLGAAKGIGQIRNGDRRLTNAVAAGVLRIGADIGVVVATFYLVWGFNYARPPLESRQQWNGAEADVEELARLAQEMIEAANFEYATITGADDSGQPTVGPQGAELIAQLATGWEATEEILGVPT